MKTTIDAVIGTQRTQREWRDGGREGRREGGREEGRERGLKCKLCRTKKKESVIGLLSQSAMPYSAYPSYTVTKYFTDVYTTVTCIIHAS